MRVRDPLRSFESKIGGVENTVQVLYSMETSEFLEQTILGVGDKPLLDDVVSQWQPVTFEPASVKINPDVIEVPVLVLDEEALECYNGVESYCLLIDVYYGDLGPGRERKEAALE